jgi:ornithine cyclodeaminase/alanine dehydrogenase-like protein (mu-crystallin family)
VGVEPPDTNGVLLAMPCAVAEPPALGAKIVSVFRDNARRGLPTVTSMYVLSDYETGAPLAIMDGSYLTAIRTAAGSAVATRALAREDVRTLGIFGTGVQARHHVLAIKAVRPLERVLVCGSSAHKAAEFARWVSDTIGIDAAPATAEVASAADIVAACTTSATPVVVDARVQPGGHVNAVGAFTPTTRELPTSLIARAKVYVDTRAGACSEAGDLLLPVQEGAFSLDRVAGEVGEVLLGQAPGRRANDEVTVYKSVGAAFLDAATARLAYTRALELTVGTLFDFDVG